MTPSQRIEIKDVFSLYSESDFVTKSYLRIKLKICPLIHLESYFPEEGKIVDLGCGSGLFSNILGIGSSRRHIVGADLDEKKIAAAERTKGRLANIEYTVGNIAAMNYPTGDVFSLIDVLYLIPYEAQEVILKKCAAALSPNGTLIVKEMDTRPRWKYFWNYWQETIAVKIIGFTLGERFYFRSKDSFENLLSGLGFCVNTVRLDRGYWYPHIAYICTKSSSS
jgi:2-polyprenyl-6-hydroxyphenyl methylase/3-demethylubiquinone-9 3-methyltransferase